jgi:hypothetical protein
MANRIRPHNVRQNTTQKTKRLSNTNPTRMNSGYPEMKAFPVQLVVPFVYSCKNNPMINQKKGPACDYDTRDISVVICDTDSKLQFN